MTATSAVIQRDPRRTQRRPNWRSIALPAEHGGWGFLLEPIILGLLLAPTWAGLLLGLAAAAAFLVHQPLKIALKGVRQRRLTPRVRWAIRFAALYALLALSALALVIASAEPYFLLPVLMAAPLVMIQQSAVARNKSRSVVAELAGAVALGASVASILMLGGWALLPALTIWLILAIRAVLSVLYVRDKLRLERGHPNTSRMVWGLHVGGTHILIFMALADTVPYLSVIAMSALTLRAALGLRRVEGIQPKVVGFREMGFGALVVVLTALGVALNI